MKIEFNSLEQKVIDAVRHVSDQQNRETFVIGGLVRDKILNRRSKKDMDIVTVGDGISIAVETARFLGCRPPQIFKRFGTAMIRHQDMEIEFVGARKESYSEDSRKPSVSVGSLEDDQKRRDFTINALAVQISGAHFGRFLDPFDGVKDLKDKIIRTPLEPGKTFSDDPLRMMRAIRFATQLGFKIEPTTFNGLINNRDRIKIVSQERITAELNKIILAPKPSIGFELMLYSGLCELIFWEFYALKGVDYQDGRGHKDNYFHTAEVLDNVARVSEDLWLRWAAVLHDIGKPRTKRFDPISGWTFHGHDAVGANMVPKIFRRLKLPMDAKMHYVKKLVRLHLRPISLTKEEITDSAIRRLLFDAGEEIDDLMTLCQADITTKNASKMMRYLANYELVKQKMIDVEEKDRMRNWQPPITGEMIMTTFGLPPSRTVGDIKTAIREAILDGAVSNDYDEAFAFMINFGKELGLNVKSSE